MLSPYYAVGQLVASPLEGKRVPCTWCRRSPSFGNHLHTPIRLSLSPAKSQGFPFTKSQILIHYIWSPVAVKLKLINNFSYPCCDYVFDVLRHVSGTRSHHQVKSFFLLVHNERVKSIIIKTHQYTNT